MPKKRGHGDGGLYYLKDRRLWRGAATYEDENGQRRWKYVHSKSQRECLRKLKALLDEIDENGKPLDKTITVAEWFPRWLEDYKAPDIDPKTHAGYKSAINRWIVPTIGKQRVAELKPSSINAVHRAIRSAGRGTSTLRQAHIVCDMALETARREGLCRKNVAKDIDKPEQKQAKRGSLGLEAAAELLQLVADDDLASYWWFKLLEGPRQTEGLGARVADLDLDPEQPNYTVSWKLEDVQKKHGCGDKRANGWPCGYSQGAACPKSAWDVPAEFEMVPLFGRWCLTEPKSRTGRYVPLIEEVADLIDEYLTRHADTPNPYGLIWRKDDGTPYLPKEEAQMWRDVLHRAGIITADQTAPGKSPIDGHWARHTTVSLLMMLTGGDAQLVGEIVGHSSAEVTEIYRHADQREKHRAMKKLGTRVQRAISA